MSTTPARKRKRTGTSKVSAPPKKPPGVKKKPVACSRCRSQKVKCEVLDGHIVCSKCIASGDQVAEECDAPGTHGSSVAESVLDQPDSHQSIPHHGPTSSAMAVAAPPPPSKRQRSVSRSTSYPPPVLEPSGASFTNKLNAILETNEYLDPPTVNTDFDEPTLDSDSVASSRPDPLDRANAFFDTVTAGPSHNVDGSASETSENFDLDAVESSVADNEERKESDGLDDDSDSELDRQLRAKRIELKATKSKAAQQAKTSRSSDKSKKTPLYDPDTCNFTISCTARQPDGSKAPFQIESTIPLKKLLKIIADRMDRSSRLIRLQYRLDSDKASQGATSVQNEEEFNMFKAKMRSLIVPGLTKTGHISGRTLKNVTVNFTDASMDSNDQARPKGASKTSSGATKQKSDTSSSGQFEGASRREQLIKQLQERWKCDIHAKGPESPTYCYVPDEKSEHCYPLTINNLSFWAIQIMDGKATVDTKPVGLPTQTARLRTRNSVVQPSSLLGGQGVSGPGMPGPPGYPGGFGGYGYGYMPPYLPWGGMAVPGMQLPPRAPSPVPSNASGAHLQAGTSSTSRSRSVSPLPPASVPAIAKWLSYLDQHAERSQDGVKYSEFEGTLHEKGFTRLSQLTSKHVTASDIQQWLGVSIGTAVNLKDYADDDLEAVRRGNLVIV